MKYNLISNIIYVIKNIFRYQKKIFVLLPLGILIIPLCQYAWAFVLKITIDAIFQQTEERNLFLSLITSGIIIFILFFIRNIYKYTIDTPFIIVRMKMTQEKNLKMMRMPFYLTENPEILDLSQRAEAAICDNNVGFEGMERNFASLLETFGTFSIGIILFYKINPIIIIIFFIVALISFLTNLIFSLYAKKNIWDLLIPLHRKNFYLTWTLSNPSYGKDIRLFNLKQTLLNKVREVHNTKNLSYRKFCKINYFISIFNIAIFTISQFFLYRYLLGAIINTEITPGEFTLYLSSSLFFYNSISSLFNIINQLYIDSKAVSDFRLFMNLGVNNDTLLNKRNINNTESINLEFKNVSFKYPNSKDYNIKNINLKISQNDKIALVGLNGAGKSTLIKLLLKLYSPTNGTILLNGEDIQLFTNEDYNSLFSVEFQDIKTYSFSVLENIIMKNKKELDDEKLNFSIDNAGLRNKIESLKQGIDSKIGPALFEDGIDLSGGEKQKLAFSRALYKKGKVFIFDEPTSAMDPFSEREFYEYFNEHISGPTIFISHRLSSTQFFDKIVVMKDGEIIESGSHEDLLEKKGYYYQLYTTQAETYK